MISYGDLFVYGSLLAADVYVFWTLYRANRAITRYGGLMDRIEAFIKQFEDPKIMRKTVRMIFGPEIKKLHDVIESFGIYKDPRVIVGVLENTIMSTLAHLGAKNLKELGYKKEKINQIVMARNGVQAVGNLAAEGAGLNDLLGKAAGSLGAKALGGEGNMLGTLIQMFAPNLFGGKNEGGGGSGGGTIG